MLLRLLVARFGRLLPSPAKVGLAILEALPRQLDRGCSPHANARAR